MSAQVGFASRTKTAIFMCRGVGVSLEMVVLMVTLG